MLTDIDLILPHTGRDSEEALAALKWLLKGQRSGNTVSFAPSPDSEDLFPNVSLMLRDVEQSSLRFVSNGDVEYPEGFFNGKRRAEPAMPFTEAAARLTDAVIRLDHIGIMTPRDMPADAWQYVINYLAENTFMLDYPDKTDLYDRQEACWLFLMSIRTNHENGEEPEPRHLRKVEIIWDGLRQEPVVQFDIELRRSFAQIEEIFPNSFAIPGLGHIFRSVPVEFPWFSGRLDLRPSNGGLNEWTSGEWLMKNGTRVHPGDPATRLPKFING